MAGVDNITTVYSLQNFVQLSSNLVLVTLLPQSKNNLKYIAGQYLEILYPDHSFQPFSIANAPSPDHHLELHIRQNKEDHALNEMLMSLQKNKKITIRGSFGTAYYRTVPDLSIILLAGGTGFAYTKAILEQAEYLRDKRAFHLYWNVRTTDDFYLTELLDHWSTFLPNFHYTLIISQPTQQQDWKGKIGYAHQNILMDYPNLSNFQVYASGPFAMIQTAWNLFQQHGLKKVRMHSDML